MIKITYQDSSNQYDEDYNEITEWNEKYCSWIVLPEYEEAYKKGEIDWWGEDNDFPRGCTKEEYLEMFPEADRYPNISVTWYWDHDGYKKQFKEELKGDYNFSFTNSWGYLNYDEDEAVVLCGHYCDFNKHAYQTVVEYNGKVIFDGKLE